MTIFIEFGGWIAPAVEHQLFGTVLHIGWVSVGIVDGRLSDRLIAWRSKLQAATQA